MIPGMADMEHLGLAPVVQQEILDILYAECDQFKMQWHCVTSGLVRVKRICRS